MATATVDGELLTSFPRNDLDGSDHCGIVILGASGDVRWRDTLPSEGCNAHAVGDIGVGDFDDDGQPEFLAPTDTRDVIAYDAATGEETFRQELLGSIAYSAPVVANLTADGKPELIVVDFVGNLTVVHADGSVAWTQELTQPVYVTPLVADFTGDGTPELVLSHGRRPSEVVCFDGSGEIVWRTEQEYALHTWTLADREEGPNLVVAAGDQIASLDGATGDSQWTTSIDERAAVGDVDQNSVYVTARNGTAHALALDGGAGRWTKQVTDEDVRMRAPALGAVSGEGNTDLVTTADDGTVAVLEADSGDLLARRRLDVGIYTPPVPADVTGDGRDEILVLYGDGRVAALSYAE